MSAILAAAILQDNGVFLIGNNFNEIIEKMNLKYDDNEVLQGVKGIGFVDTSMNFYNIALGAVEASRHNQLKQEIGGNGNSILETHPNDFIDGELLQGVFELRKFENGFNLRQLQ